MWRGHGDGDSDGDGGTKGEVLLISPLLDLLWKHSIAAGSVLGGLNGRWTSSKQWHVFPPMDLMRVVATVT